MLEGEDMRTQVEDKGSAWREGGRQVRSSKRNGWLGSSVRSKVMGCVVSLTSSVLCSATDHVVESDSDSGSRSKSELSANVHSQPWSQCQSRPATSA